MKTVSRIEQIPKHSHRVVLRQAVVETYNGYEASHSGGYSQQHYLEYLIFDNEKQFQNWLQTSGKDTSSYVVMDVFPRPVKVTVQIQINENES